MIDIAKKSFGIVALILAITNTIDLIFYWPGSGYDTFYLIKLVTATVACSYVAWLFFVKSSVTQLRKV